MLVDMSGASDALGPTLTRRRPLWLALVIGALATAPALLNAPIYDDELLIFSNKLAQDVSHLVENVTCDFLHASGSPDARMGYYRPIVKLAFMLQYQAFGVRVLGYHAASIAAWLSVIALAAALAQRLRVPRATIGVAAALGASHPSCASAVGTITSQSDLFVAVAMLASVYAYLRHCERGALGWLALALASETLALGCKEIAVLTPLVMVASALADAPTLSFRALRDTLRLRRELWLFVPPVVLYGVLRVSFDVLPVHAARAGGALGMLATAAKVACSATLRAFVPTAWLPLVHALRPPATLVGLASWLVPALALGTLSCVLFVRRSALRPWLALFWLPLAPLITGEFMIHTTEDTARFTISDRWLVLPAVVASYGLAALLVLARARSSAPLRLLLGVGLGMLVVVQTLITIEETASYASENTRVMHVADLYREHGVNDAYARRALLADEAVRAELQNDPRRAARAYAGLVRLEPDDRLLHYNVAVTSMRAGDTRAALSEAYVAYHGVSLDGRLQLGPHDSENRRRAERAFLLAQLFEKTGDAKNAARYFRECYTLRPDFPGVRESLARVEGGRG